MALILGGGRGRGSSGRGTPACRRRGRCGRGVDDLDIWIARRATSASLAPRSARCRRPASARWRRAYLCSLAPANIRSVAPPSRSSLPTASAARSRRAHTAPSRRAPRRRPSSVHARRPRPRHPTSARTPRPRGRAARPVCRCRESPPATGRTRRAVRPRSGGRRRTLVAPLGVARPLDRLWKGRPPICLREHRPTHAKSTSPSIVPLLRRISACASAAERVRDDGVTSRRARAFVAVPGAPDVRRPAFACGRRPSPGRSRRRRSGAPPHRSPSARQPLDPGRPATDSHGGKSARPERTMRTKYPSRDFIPSSTTTVEAGLPT